MIYELGKPEDLQAVYNVVQHTIKTIYPQYYPMEVVDFFCGHHSEDAIYDRGTLFETKEEASRDVASVMRRVPVSCL